MRNEADLGPPLGYAPLHSSLRHPAVSTPLRVWQQGHSRQSHPSLDPFLLLLPVAQACQLWDTPVLCPLFVTFDCPLGFAWKLTRLDIDDLGVILSHGRFAPVTAAELLLQVRDDVEYRFTLPRRVSHRHFSQLEGGCPLNTLTNQAITGSLRDTRY